MTSVSPTDARLTAREWTAVGLLLALGAALRLWQYAADTSLWLDELAVARNVINRSLPELLLTPLDFDQVAPRGFLFVEKLVVWIFGDSDLALRLFPLLCGLSALGLFWAIARRTLQSAAQILALALFACGIPFILLGSQVKQYAVDLAVALLLIRLTLPLSEAGGSWRRGIALGAVGVLAVWFSHAAVLVLAGLGASLLVLAWYERRPLGALRWTLVLWFAGCAGATMVSFAATTPAMRDHLRRFWAQGFLPLPPWPLPALRWLWGRYRDLLGTGGLRYPWPGLYALLSLAGLGMIWQRDRRAATLLIGPMIATLMASAVQQYPFGGRLANFFLPVLLLGIAEATWWLARRIPSRLCTVRALTLSGAVALPVWAIATNPPVYRIEEMKPLLAAVRARWTPGDVVYVSYGAAHAMRFYGPLYGFTHDDYVLGGCHRQHRENYPREIDRFRGQPRVWIVFSHLLGRFDELTPIVNHLDSIGRRLDHIAVASQLSGHAPTVQAYLYDLSGSPRIEPHAVDPPDCHGGPEATAEGRPGLR